MPIVLQPPRSPVLGDAPRPVLEAWRAYRNAGGRPDLYCTEPRTPERHALEKTCWDVLRRRGLVICDGWLIGWVGRRHDRTFAVSPAARSLRPETHCELTTFYLHYGHEFTDTASKEG